MGSREIESLYQAMMDRLLEAEPVSWEEITDFLADLSKNAPPIDMIDEEEYLKKVRGGAAFWTFDFGIDGVSIEISKYARCLEEILGRDASAVHFIAGDFHPQADNVLQEDWKRHQIDRVNGWDKWDQGRWFDHLFYQEMKEGSDISHEMAREIWRQAVEMAANLGRYIAENEISLLIPVNVNSNPGNLATGLCTVLVSELMGLYVLNSNHDFYWEGGKPPENRNPGEPAGPRDKFFLNWKNEPFFSFLKTIYPWNGRRWIQVNINTLQSEKLITAGFPEDRVLEISTMVSDEFFKEFSRDDVNSARIRMAHILSDGNRMIQTVAGESFLKGLRQWMSDQKPLVCAAREGLRLDLASEQIIYLLQPTRIIDRKRIEKDWQLIAALLRHPSFKDEFNSNPARQIVLHITGPAPIEHQEDLESVLHAFLDVIHTLPEQTASRLFMAFSIGTEFHPSFVEAGFEKLTIEEIYRLATAVVFPSLTEGRGLPIIESSAAGIPIICSRYHPEKIFAGVVGEDLPENQRIRYIPFPEEIHTEKDLDEISRTLIHPQSRAEENLHNKHATRQRYSKEVMLSAFRVYLEKLRTSR